MSLFGTNTGFGTGGTGVFGNTTTDSHNPMKVNQRSTGENACFLYIIISGNCNFAWLIDSLIIFFVVYVPTGCWSDFTSRWQHQLSGFQSSHHARELSHWRILGQWCQLVILFMTMNGYFNMRFEYTWGPGGCLHRACLPWRTSPLDHEFVVNTVCCII